MAIINKEHLLSQLENRPPDGWISVQAVRAMIEQEEEKTGRWIYNHNEYDDSTYECSSCGEPWTLIDGNPKENGMNYCPNCGARMRGAEE